MYYMHARLNYSPIYTVLPVRDCVFDVVYYLQAIILATTSAAATTLQIVAVFQSDKPEYRILMIKATLTYFIRKIKVIYSTVL
jgi:hypothetical protein